VTFLENLREGKEAFKKLKTLNKITKRGKLWLKMSYMLMILKSSFIQP